MKANTRKLLIAGAWACCAAATAHAQATASVISDGEIARKGQSEQSVFKRATSAPELQDQAQRQQAQARATVNANLANKDATGITVPTAAQLEQESRKQRELHRESLSAANSDTISQIRNTLPRLSDLGGQLKYGNHFVVSRNGQTIIGLIRATSSTQGQDLSTTLKQIEDHAHAGAPEAIHFLGFASENGLFGAPKSIQKAIGLYREAANSKYQPAVYNLALVAAYGKEGRPDFQKALALAAHALSLGPDASGRVCGLASFLAFRLKRSSEAIDYSKGCNSPLAHLAQITQADTVSLPRRVERLRDTIATGANDGFAVIAKISRPLTKTDNNMTYCKYALVARHYDKKDYGNLKAEAAQCIRLMEKEGAFGTNAGFMREQVIAGIAGFVPSEITELEKMRQANKFHYGWAVPYLAFAQAEVDLFEPLLNKGVQR
jgi:TPR repeat protein